MNKKNISKNKIYDRRKTLTQDFFSFLRIPIWRKINPKDVAGFIYGIHEEPNSV